MESSYSQARRIYTARPYPLSAPNGSTIILIGNENGLEVLWRGGRPIKDQSKKRSWKDDGTLNHENLLESEDDADSDTTGERASHGENEEGFDSIIQSINLSFGTAVLHVAFPFIPVDTSQHNAQFLPVLFSDHLVAVLICSDSSVRLLTLPLAPPSRLRKSTSNAVRNSTLTDDKKGPYGEQVVVISGGNNHQSVPRSASLTLAPSSARPDSDLELTDDGIQSRRNASTDHRRLASGTRSRSRSVGSGHGWDLLVASSSSDLSGLLLIHRVPLSPDGSLMHATATDCNVPWSIRNLSSPATSLSFNPSLPGDERNCRLLIAEKKGMVRIVSCLDPSTSDQCSFLTSLYPGLQSPTTGQGSRRHVLDAQWVLGGKAVLVLLADGEWGLWDLEGHGSKVHSGTKAPQILTLGALFTFAISGYVNDRPNNFEPDNVNSKNKKSSKPGILAPTTPGTRRMRQESLFSGPLHQVGGPNHGGLSIVRGQASNAADEAVLLWHNDNVVLIPSLRTYWANKTKGSANLFGNGTKAEARNLSKVSLRGERRTDVALCPATEQNSEYIVLVAGESRFVLVQDLSRDAQTTLRRPPSPLSNQMLLDQGDLDLDGMDRVLSTMTEKKQTSKFPANGVHRKKKVVY